MASLMAASAPQWLLPSVPHNQQLGKDRGGEEEQTVDRLRPSSEEERLPIADEAEKHESRQFLTLRERY